jgi:hypothetical protein
MTSLKVHKFARGAICSATIIGNNINAGDCFITKHDMISYFPDESESIALFRFTRKYNSSLGEI